MGDYSCLVDTQTEWDSGTLSDVVATSSDTLELTNNPYLSFDGIDDYVDIPIARNNSDLTIEFWFRTTYTGKIVRMFGFEDLSGTIQVLYLVYNPYNNKFRFQRYNGGNSDEISADAMYNDGSWHHVAITYDISEAGTTNCGDFYVDGANVSNYPETTGNGDNMTTDLNWFIGSFNSEVTGDYCFPGDIDDFRIWSDIRTQTEIQDNMNKELNGDETGLVAYYKMNDDSDTTTATDSAGTNDGTINGAIYTTNSTRYITNGNRESNILDISTVSTVESSSFSWTETLNSQTTTYETNISFDGGSTWTGWQEVTSSGDPIPQISSGDDLSNARLQTRQTLDTSNTTISPYIDSMTITITETTATNGSGTIIQTTTTIIQSAGATSTTGLGSVILVSTSIISAVGTVITNGQGSIIPETIVIFDADATTSIRGPPAHFIDVTADTINNSTGTTSTTGTGDITNIPATILSSTGATITNASSDIISAQISINIASGSSITNGLGSITPAQIAILQATGNIGGVIGTGEIINVTDNIIQGSGISVSNSTGSIINVNTTILDSAGNTSAIGTGSITSEVISILDATGGLVITGNASIINEIISILSADGERIIAGSGSIIDVVVDILQSDGISIITGTGNIIGSNIAIINAAGTNIIANSQSNIIEVNISPITSAGNGIITGAGNIIPAEILIIDGVGIIGLMGTRRISITGDNQLNHNYGYNQIELTCKGGNEVVIKNG